MQISGTIKRDGNIYYVSATVGKYIIQPDESDKLGLTNDAVGLLPSTEIMECTDSMKLNSNVNPLHFDGWVKQGTLSIV